MLRNDDLNSVPHDAVVNTICLKMLDHKHNFPVNVSVLEDNREISVRNDFIQKKKIQLTDPLLPSHFASMNIEMGVPVWSAALEKQKKKTPLQNATFSACSLPFCQSYAAAAWSCKFSSFLVISVCRLLKAIWVGSGTIGQPWKPTGHIFTSISTVYCSVACLCVMLWPGPYFIALHLQSS